MTSYCLKGLAECVLFNHMRYFSYLICNNFIYYYYYYYYHAYYMFLVSGNSLILITSKCPYCTLFHFHVLV